MFLGFFIHNITSIYHFFMTALSAHVVLSVIYSTFPTLSKLTYSTYSFKIIWGEMNLFSKGISNRVFLNLHPVVVTVVITLSLSFLLPQHKVRLKKKHIEQRLTLHFISAFPFTFLLTALIFWESFIQDLPYPVTPKKELVSNNPLQYHSLIKNLGHTDKANDHGWKVLIIKKIINYHHQHLNRKCMGKSVEKVHTVWCNQLGVKG